MTSSMCTGVMTILSAGGLYLAQLPVVGEAMDQAAQMERLGIIGILSVLLIASVGANVWLLRRGVVKLIDLIERAIMMMDGATQACEVMTETSEQFKEAAANCERMSRERGAAQGDPKR